MLFLKKQQKQQKIWKIATKNWEKKQLFAGLNDDDDDNDDDDNDGSKN